MKGEPLKKPPPLLLPSKNHPNDLQNRVNSRTPARYDNYNGILKRVRDMKISNSSDDATTNDESDKSSVRTRSSRTSSNSGIPYSASASSEERYSTFEDESSASSVAGSDHCDNCPPYQIPTIRSRYSCSSLPSPPPSATTLCSFRDSLPPPPAEGELPVYSNEALSNSNKRRSCLSLSENFPPPLVLSRNSIYSNSNSHCNSSSHSNYEPDYLNTLDTLPLYSNETEESTTDINENKTPTDCAITDAELRQVEMFFRSLRTELWVSRCLANLYIKKDGDWVLKYTGIPLVVLESGDTRSRIKRKIVIVLAERGTCFPLWRDTIDNLSAYQQSEPAFHTLCLSTDHRQVFGLAFDSATEADKLMNRIETLTSDPENINISVPGAKKKKSSKSKLKKMLPLPQKKQISNPCLFEHVTSVSSKDHSSFKSFALIDNARLQNLENIA